MTSHYFPAIRLSATASHMWITQLQNDVKCWILGIRSSDLSMFGRCDSTCDSMSILYADGAYRCCHVSIRQTGFPRTPSRPMSPYGGGFGRFGGRMAVVTLFISYWDHFMRNFNLVCNSVHVFPRIAIKFCMCDFTPSTLEPVFSQFFHEISVSSEFFFWHLSPSIMFVCSSSVQRVVARLVRLKIEPTGPFSVRPTPNSRKCLLGGHIIKQAVGIWTFIHLNILISIL